LNVLLPFPVFHVIAHVLVHFAFANIDFAVKARNSKLKSTTMMV